MASAPLVSIIVAAFNAEQQITGALTSALQQDIDVEVIVVDDASSDATRRRVAEFPSARVHLVALRDNRGPAAARNAAIAAARGAWLSILDADDHMEPGRLKDLVAEGVRTRADIVADNMIVDRRGVRSLFIKEALDGGSEILTLATYALENRPFVQSRGYGYLKPVFRAETLRRLGLRYDEDLRIGEDFMLVAELLARGAVYRRRRSAGYVYSVHDGSISHRLSARNAEAMAAADREFLAKHAPSLAADAALGMRKHLASVEDAAAYARMIEALKARAALAFLTQAARRPLAMRHLTLPVRDRIRRRLSR